ncbi:hypothetical protein [Flavisericum labens]|uniref:hypothetical protein n=1 Tax=Flavisericum labens TaxID=3377112 RepID=UPI00387B4F31
MGNSISLCLMGVCKIIGFSQNSINQNSETIKQDSTFVSDNFPLNDWSYRVGLFASYGVITDDLDDNFKILCCMEFQRAFNIKRL